MPALRGRAQRPPHSSLLALNTIRWGGGKKNRKGKKTGT